MKSQYIIENVFTPPKFDSAQELIKYYSEQYAKGNYVVSFFAPPENITDADGRKYKLVCLSKEEGCVVPYYKLINH